MKKTHSMLALILAAIMLVSAFAGCININLPAEAGNTEAPDTSAPAADTSAPAADTEAPASEEPTEAPEDVTSAPTDEPAITEAPTDEPVTEAPTEAPTQAPTAAPTAAPEAMTPVICAGYDRAFALYPNGELYGWGTNGSGQVGNGTTKDVKSPAKILSNVKKVFVCPYNTYALKKDGTLWGWGSNEDMILGMREKEVYKSPTKIRDDVVDVISAGYGNYFITKDNKLLVTGEAEDSYDAIVIRMNDVKTVFGSCALKTNGDLYYLGWEHDVKIDSGVSEAYPQMDLGVCGYLKKNGELWLTLEPEDGSTVQKLKLGSDIAEVVDISNKYEYERDYLAVKKNGELWEFTLSEYTGVKSKKLLSGVKEVCAALIYDGFSEEVHAFALLENGDVYFRGEPDAASGLKKGKTAKDFTKVASDAVFVDTNGVGSYIIKSDGSLYGCGVVKKGVRTGGVGNGTYEDVWTFKKIMDGVRSFTQLTMLFEDYDEEDIGDMPGSTISSTTRFAVKNDGSLWAWGSAQYSTLGNGGTKRADSPVKIIDPKY